MRKNNAKRWGHRALALMLALLLVQTAPLAPLAVSAASTAAQASVAPEETQVNQATEETQVTEATEETQVTEATEETQVTEATEETQVTEATEETQVTEATEETQVTEATEETQIAEATEETQVTEATEETQGTEATEETQGTEATEETQGSTAADKVQVFAASGTVQVTTADDLPSVIPAGMTYELANDITYEYDSIDVQGVLDGKGHTITLIGQPLAENVTGKIQNLIVKSSRPMRRNNSGSIAVYLTGGKLYNCLSTVTMYGDVASQMGGLVYRAEAGSEIRNCIFAGEFTKVAGYSIVRDAIDLSNPVKPSTFSNCFFDSSNKKGAIGNGKEGTHYYIKLPVEGKTVEEMKTAEFVDQLNQQKLGTGFIWKAAAGQFPILVSGGEIFEQANLDNLKAAIKDAESRHETNYTKDTWAAMQEVLTRARATVAEFGVSQEKVNAAAAELNAALKALKEKVRDHFPVELPKDGIVYISSAQEFKKMHFDDPNKVYQLTQDIEINSGFINHPVKGVFDGGGHTITLNYGYSGGVPLFSEILSTGVVQNLNVRVEGSSTNHEDFAPYAGELKGGMIVNCVSQVSGQCSTGFVMKMTEGGVMANCLTMGHNRRGAFVHFQKSTDHRNTNGFSDGKFYNCYWASSNSVENILEISQDSMFSCRPIGDEELRSDGFMGLLNQNKGTNGRSWGRDSEGYPYLGEDKGDHVIDGSQNLYPVEFVWHDGRVETVENGRLELSPQMTTDNNRVAGKFQLKNVPEGSTISWSSEDRSNRDVIAVYENAELCVFQDGGAVVRATERKADGSEQLAAEIRVVSNSQKIEQLRLVLDGKVVEDEITVKGSEDKTLEIQARYAGESDFKPLPSYLVKMQPKDRDYLFTSYNSSTFHCKKPGSSVLEVVTPKGDVSVSVTVTSKYVPVKSVKPGLAGQTTIHGRNSMGSGQFNDIPVTVNVEPANASYKDNYTVESSNLEIAEFGSRKSYVPFKNGTVTFTAKINDDGKIVQGTSEVTFVYQNPLVSVTTPSEKINAEVGKKQKLDLTFTGKNANYAAVSEPELVWTYSKTGIVSINRPSPLTQLRDTNSPDAGDWVASTEYELKPMRPGTVKVTGTPVDKTAGAKPVTFTVTVTGDEANIPVFDIPKFIAAGKAAATKHLMGKIDYSFGQEWNIYALMRDGQKLPQDKLDSYYRSAAATVKSWKSDILATEIERTALALSIIGKDITNVDGINLANMICNHPNLARQGSNALTWGLIALDLKNTPIPAGAKWTRERMVKELLTYQNPDGGFGLSKNGGSGLDITAMTLQALSFYQNMDGVQEAVERGVAYMAKCLEKNLDYGNAESISQVVIALSVLGRDLVTEPGFGDQVDNLMSALEAYLVEDQGFEHAKGQGVNTMATVQVMQALCAYERLSKNESGYWDLLGNRPVFDPVANVIEMIDKLPGEITLKDIAAVRAARKAFDSLRPQQQENVTNIDKLLKAEEAVKNLSQNDKKALEVMDLISELPETPTLKNAQQVRAARQAYNALTAEQRKKVTNTDKLLKAEKTIADLETAQEVIDAIHAFPKPITAEAKAAIEAARQAYNALSNEQKELVVNRYMLEKAEKELEDALAVKKVVDAINALPETVKKEDGVAIKTARAAYEQLSDALKAQVTNLDKLQKAEKALKALRVPSGKPGGAAQEEIVSNLVEAKVENGKVSAEQLENIQGKDMLLQINGTMETGEKYVLTIYGKDISKAADLNTLMTRKGMHEDDIRKLADNPEIFRFAEDGAFPASMLVQLESKLENGQYLLMHFDPVQRNATLVTRADVKDGQVQFVLQEGGEYFLAKKASAKSLLNDEETAKPTEETMAPESTEETVPQIVEQNNTSGGLWIWLVLAAAVVIGAAILCVVYMQKKKEQNK